MTTEYYQHRSDERKRTILEAASRVFAEVGYEKATLAALADAVGLSQPGLLHHYPSKAQLLIAVLAYRDTQASGEIGIESDVSGLDILGGLAEMFRGQLQRPEIIQLFAKVTAEATNPEHPAHEWATERYYWGRMLYTQAFARDLREGRLRAGVDPEHVARSLMALMDGLQVQWLLDPAFDAAAVFAEFVESLASAIRA